MQAITKNIKEVIGEDEIKAKLVNKGVLNIYWGVSPTLSPHFAYFLPLLKLRDLISEGHNVTILIADVHSYLEQGIEKSNDVEQQTQLYDTVITSMLHSIGVKKGSYSIIKGSDYQFDSTYCIDLLKLSSVITLENVCNVGQKHLISNALYPLLQCLDETYLDADIQLGGEDQRKIFELSRNYIEKIGYNKCSYLITPLIPSLKCKNGITKMSASVQHSKIELTDTIEDINKKINSAGCSSPKNSLDTNPLLSILKYILFEVFNVIINLRQNGKKEL